MSGNQVNFIVCIDPRRCLHLEVDGRNGRDLLAGLQASVDRQGLAEVAQITPCNCIFGCTFGPRIDVARRWSGEKQLFGSLNGSAAITRRGVVEFSRIPPDLDEFVRSNLPAGGNHPPLER